MRFEAPEQKRHRTFVLTALTTMLVLTSSAAGREAEEVSARPWDLPAADSCDAALLGPPGRLEKSDAVATLKTGDVTTAESVSSLRAYIPTAIWDRREYFFHEGMRLEVGDCFRDYSPPEFYGAATRDLAGEVRLDEKGGLVGHRAGLPFPPVSIDPDDPSAGTRWAWNADKAYRAGGQFGEIRFTFLRWFRRRTRS
ncbi:MAG: DUF1329 domain-containing protein [Planctomycetota bacterium]